jgi:DtxR family Mn-dependent transcriptional regulator
MMDISEKAQELLEQLWVNAEEEGQSGLPINGLLPDGAEELLRLGLTEQSNGCLTLTQIGFPEATLAVRRHRLAERLLADVLTTEPGQVDEQACRLEHALFNDLDDSICTLLGHPTFCPHGRLIPPGECCHQMKESVSPVIAPLCRLQPGQQGRISYIQMKNPSQLQKLMAMNVLPGKPLTLLRRVPSFVFEIGYSQFAVDEELASAIFIRIN